jgi:hypothetical protein
MTRKLLLAGLAAAFAAPLLAQPLLAPPAPTTPTAPMAMGQTVTRAEVQARVEEHFAKRDANRDGVLTTDELPPRGEHRAMKMRHHGEMGEHSMGDPTAAFDRIDANRDGSISREEFAKGRQIRIEKRVVVNQPGQPGQSGAMRGMHHGGGMMGAAIFKLADANHDGRVTLAEATTGALRHFDMMDANRDGRLTPQERAAGRVQIRQIRKAG